MRPMVSVIIPVYNVCEVFLRNCIESFLNQTFNKFELLLIDDGSQDGSGLICDEYSKLDQRVRVFHQSNEGVSAARNLGIDSSYGDWLSFFDADDWVEPTYLETMIIESEKEKDCDMVLVGGFDYRDGVSTISYRVGADRLVFQGEDMQWLRKFVFDRRKRYGFYLPNFGGPTGQIYKSKVVKCNNLRFPLGVKNAEDTIFCYYCMLCCKKVVALSTPLWHYRFLENSASHKISREKWDDLKKITEYFGKNTVKDVTYQNYIYEFLISKLFQVYRMQTFNVELNETYKKQREEFFTNINEQWVNQLIYSKKCSCITLKAKVIRLFSCMHFCLGLKLLCIARTVCSKVYNKK